MLVASTIDTGEPLLDSSEPVPSEVSERLVDPSRLLGDVHESDHSVGDLLVGHLSEVGDDRAVGLFAKPGLVEVGVEARDDIVLFGIEPGGSLFLGHGEDGVVELSPELDSSGGDLVDGLAELGSDGEDAACDLVVRSLPLVVVDSGGVNNELLDRGRRVRLGSDHDSRGKEHSIERHGLGLEPLDRPVSGEVGPDVLRASETGSGDERDVGVGSDRSVGGEDGLVDVLTRVVTTGSTSGPLKDDGEVGVGGGDVDDLSDALDGSGLERDMLDAGRLEGRDDLDSLLGRRDTGGDAKSLDGKTLSPHLLPKRELEGELPLVDVEGVEGDTDSGSDSRLDVGDLGSEGSGVVVGSSGELDVVAGVEDGRDEASSDSRGGHTGDHDGGLTEKSREGRVDVNLAVLGLDELGTPLLDPPNLLLAGHARVDLGANLALVSRDNNLDALALEVSAGKGSDTAGSSRSKIDGMGSAVGEGGGLVPVDGRREDLVAEGGGEGGGELSEVRS